MDNILIAKDLAYASKIGGGVIAGSKELDLLADGALAFIGDNGTLLTAANAAATLADMASVQIAVGRGDLGKNFLVKRKSFTDINLVNYKAHVLPVITVTFPTLASDDSGDVSVSVKDTSFASNYNIRTKNASVYKKAGVAQTDVTTQLVTKLNAGNTWFTAAKTSATVITITPKDAKVTLGVSANGLAEGSTIATTTDLVYGSGAGADVLQMEKDFSANEGNGGYTELSDLWYKQNMSADVNTNYDLITLTFDGEKSTASTKKIVAQRRLVIATDTTAAANAALHQDTDNVMALLALIFPTAYSGASAAETGTDDGTENDGVAGN